MSLKLAKLVKKKETPTSTTPSPVEWVTVVNGALPPTHSASPLLTSEVGFPDTTILDSPDEDLFLQNLKVRFLNKKIYVSFVNVLLSI